MSSAAVADAPIGLRARSDLIAKPQTYQGRRFWCIKDPVALAYFHLRDEEYEILRALEVRVNLTNLLATFHRKFPALSIDGDQIRHFLAGLYRSGLVVVESPGQGEKLWDRHERARRRAWLGMLPGILAIRLRGIDPSRVLRTIYDHVWWVFSAYALTFFGAIGIAAILIVLTRFDEIIASIPTAGAFFTAEGIATFFVAMGAIKIAHEIGHGLTCLRFGGECHEMGVMFLVFAPCLYCDVSDTWLFPEKWRRIAVAAAGIAVELSLASIATLIWAASEPGFLHAFCVNVMLICSVNTLLFNGNPLLRYDGYFILSDLVEVPNLASEARGAVSRLVLGRDDFDPTIDSREVLLLAYGLAAAVYRLFVTSAIVWFCLKMLTPLGLASVGYLLAVMCVVGLLAGPTTALASAFVAPEPRRFRALFTLAVLSGIMLIVAMMPLPHRVTAAAILRPRDATQLFVRVGGTLMDALGEGTAVKRGETIGRLTDATLEAEVVQLESRHAELQAQINVLEGRRLTNPALAAQLPATRQALEAAALQLERRRSELADLVIQTPRPGTIISPPVRTAIETDDELSAWSGTPIDSENVGSYLEAGTLFCLVGDPDAIEAVALIDEGSIAFLKPGQKVRLQFDQAAGGILDGTVEEIATDALRVVPAELANAALLPVRRTDDGVLRPTNTVYEVKVRLSGVDGSKLRIRGVGRAKIETESERLVNRFYRYLRRTFRFEL